MEDKLDHNHLEFCVLPMRITAWALHDTDFLSNSGHERKTKGEQDPIIVAISSSKNSSV